jgi:hypothetical protein
VFWKQRSVEKRGKPFNAKRLSPMRSTSGKRCIPYNKAYRDWGDFSVTTGTSERAVQQPGIPRPALPSLSARLIFISKKLQDTTLGFISV